MNSQLAQTLSLGHTMRDSIHLTPEELGNMRQGSETTVLALCEKEWEAELALYPEFQNFIEDVDLAVCQRSDLIEALRLAPTASLRMWVYRTYQFREELCMISGRSFL